MAADPFVVHVARLRRSPGQAVHEVRRGEVPQAGPIDEAGIDPGRSVVPAGADIEVDVTLTPFEGGIDVAGTVTAPWSGICRRCAEPVVGELRIPVHERFADAPLAGVSDEELYPIVDETIDNATQATQLGDRTVYYDAKNDVTVVQSDTTGKIMSARKGVP